MTKRCQGVTKCFAQNNYYTQLKCENGLKFFIS